MPPRGCKGTIEWSSVIPNCEGWCASGAIAPIAALLRHCLRRIAIAIAPT
jgi:hypothetical protein